MLDRAWFPYAVGVVIASITGALIGAGVVGIAAFYIGGGLACVIAILLQMRLDDRRDGSSR
jgi:hypothetical protein